MRIAPVSVSGLLSAVTWSIAAAQTAIPIRQVAPPEGNAAVTVAPLPTARGLSDGRVLVLSPLAAVIWVFDSSLTKAEAFFDSTKLASSGPGLRRITMYPYVGDTNIVIDVASNALLVLDPRGVVARVTAPPRVSDLSTMASGAIGRFPGGADSRGRLVYRGRYVAPRPTVAPGPGVLPTTAPIDSFPIVRADFATGQIDTIAVVNAPSSFRSSSTIDQSTGRMSMTMTRNPLPRPDDWAMLADGTIAVVRAHDYHIDWVYPDGTRASTAKMAFDWRRLTDEDKQKIVDSVRNIEAISRARQDSMAAARGQPASSITIRTEVVDAKELPDYYPPIRSSGGVVADRDNNLWILPSTSAQALGGGLLYDVVNRKGELFERVQLPPLCALAGFGERGVVFLSCMVDGGLRLQRTRVVR